MVKDRTLVQFDAVALIYAKAPIVFTHRWFCTTSANVSAVKKANNFLVLRK